MMQRGVKSMIVAEIFPLHDAAGSQTSNSNNSVNLKPNLKKNLGYESGPKMDTFDEKKTEL